MRVKIDHKRKIIDLDTTDGFDGPVTSAGQIAMSLCRGFGDAIADWEINFYPEREGYTFKDGVTLKDSYWDDEAKQIVKLIKVKYCDTCEQELK
ncbi:hypothetical protein LCGC14_1144120 [marine sediment metagenome]|uniref:Uncharacterized protein n=1 Tax=marine sediment metagenome TaxID=412755 RepID=A0A0F9PFK1_9ZZZZ